MSAELGQFGLAAAAFATLNTESLSSSPSTSGGQFKLPATALQIAARRDGDKRRRVSGGQLKLAAAALTTDDQRLRSALANTSTGHAACAATTLCSVSSSRVARLSSTSVGAFRDQRGGDRRRVVVAGSQTPRQTRAAVGVGRSRHSVVDTCGGVADSDENSSRQRRVGDRRGAHTRVRVRHELLDHPRLACRVGCHRDADHCAGPRQQPQHPRRA